MITPDRKHVCRRKTKHKTEREAYASLRKLRKDEDCENPRRLWVYRCEHGGHFHIGHRPPRFVK